MADGKCEMDWTHTSHILAMLANVHRSDKKQKVLSPADVNPYAQRVKDTRPLDDADMSFLRDAFKSKGRKRGK